MPGEEGGGGSSLSGQCKVYGNLTLQQDNLTNDDNVVKFFRYFLARRDGLTKE